VTGEKEMEKGRGGCGRRWKTCQLSYSSTEFFVVQSARTKREILFRHSPVGFLPSALLRIDTEVRALPTPIPPFSSRSIVSFLVNREFEL